MSGRLSRWIFLVVIPLVVALYASYPPVDVPVQKETVVKKVAREAEEAEARQVAVGEPYVVSREVTYRRLLPLALGRRDEVARLIERREDGTIVEEVTTVVRGRISLGLDVAGGTELLYQLRAEKGKELTGAVSTTIEILRKRIDPGNVKEYRIQPLENQRILIQVPQATGAEVAQLKDRLARMGRLEFKLAVPRGTDNARFAQMYAAAEAGDIPDGYTRMHEEGDPTQPWYLVKRGDAAITGEYLNPGALQPTTDRYGFAAVAFEFNAVGARRFANITETNRGWALAIILDGALKSAPLIQDRIMGAGIIQGRFTQQEVADIINVLRAGSLPMDIELLQESTVGPQLGRDSIRKGLRALAVAGLLVLAFIGVYYMACGLVADGALLMNLVLLVGVLCLLGAALTLPGMAGILLTVGMAVDANVLIFERIREESAAGKTVRLALRNGYERAFTTIVDANVTTLLTAGILYLVGTGPVRGFAVTLSFGILLSMFTALVVTRLAFETLIDREKLSEFKMSSIMGNPRIGFSAVRRPAYVGSVLVVGLGVAAFVMRGAELYDVDFTGGSLVYLSLQKPTPVGEVRSRLAQGGFPEAEVQGMGMGQVAGAQGLTDFAVRIKGAGVNPEQSRRQAAARLRAAGLLAKDADLKVAEDRRGLELKLAEPLTEMRLREALAEGADPYALPATGTIVPQADVKDTQVSVRLREAPALADRRDLWGSMIQALGWAGLARTERTIQGWAQRPGEGEQARLDLALDGPVQPELLAVELARRQFPGLQVEPAGEEGHAFVLAGEREALAQLEKELPAGATLSLPAARIDGLTVHGTLATEFSEQDVRAFFEQRGMGEVHVLLGAPSDYFRINLSYAPVRAQMESIFGDLAQRGGGVTFAPAQDAEPAEGQVLVEMKLGEPRSFADVRSGLEAAGLGYYAEEIVVGYEDYGLATLVSELTLLLPAEKAGQFQSRIEGVFTEARPVQKIVNIGPTVAEEMQGRALLAVVFASVIIILYVALRFHAFRFGVAAVIALVHDILITAGLIALADYSGAFGDVKINLATLAAFLTILGYSLNDTIVVFDRIRENMNLTGRKRVSSDLIDLSINQTLSRTILTSATTLAVVVVLYALGGSVLKGLALTLIIGVLVGTYSSMFIASPLLLDWPGLVRAAGLVLRIVLLPVAIPFRLLRRLLGGR